MNADEGGGPKMKPNLYFNDRNSYIHCKTVCTGKKLDHVTLIEKRKKCERTQPVTGGVEYVGIKGVCGARPA